jgi:hypothetical protein
LQSEAARLELRSAYEDYLRRQRGLSERTIIASWRFAEQFLDLRFPEAADDPVKISAGPCMAAAPRIHDLRHTFAVRTMLNWYRSGMDPARE